MVNCVFFFEEVGALWPVLLGGQAQWTVGLVATLISFSSIIAADTFAFVGGKVMYLCSIKFFSPASSLPFTSQCSHRFSSVRILTRLSINLLSALFNFDGKNS